MDTTVPDAKASQLCSLWNVQFCPTGEDGEKVKPMPETFKPEDIGRIRAVLHYAIPNPDEEPYNMTIIAEIFATDPGLFANLYGAAMTVMTQANVLEVAAGNSSAEEIAT